MNLISSTKVESSSLGTSATRIWSTNSSRTGIMVHASSGNAANLLFTAVDAGASAPNLTVATAMYELSPGQTLEGDERFNEYKDIYLAMVAGTGSYDAYEVTN